MCENLCYAVQAHARLLKTTFSHSNFTKGFPALAREEQLCL